MSNRVKRLTNFECVVCGKTNTEIEDKSGQLDFCSEACCDNLEAIEVKRNEFLNAYRATQEQILRLTRDIHDLQRFAQSDGDLYNALDRYLSENE